MQPITPDTVLARSEDCLFSDLGGEVVMINLEQNSYYGLDPIGSRIWALLTVPTSLTQLCHTLQQEFEVDAESCRSDVTALLESMYEEGLIQIVAA
jgi:hypothetical protein